MLVVRSVSTPSDGALLAAVVDHRTLRVSVRGRGSGPWRLAYQVSDGPHTVPGTVVVSVRQAPEADQPPRAVKDVVTVRAGDAVSVDVLANDSDPEGGALTLSPDLITDELLGGVMFTDGSRIRYQAGAEAGTAHAVYTVTDPQGQAAGAEVTFSVRERDDAANQAPQPKPIEGRVFAGGTVRLQVPTSGVDPDGDAVALSAVGAGQRYGRILPVEDGSTLVYEAAEDGAGTDRFSYTVVDSRGATAEGEVRIGVVPRPEANQPPLASPDEMVVPPGRSVALPVLANDVDGDADELTLDPTLTGLDGAPFTAVVEAQRVVVTTPAETRDQTRTLGYVVDDGRGATADGTLTVTVSKDAPLLPPVARDDLASPGAPGSVATVDLLANDEDPDDLRGRLDVELVGPGAAAGTVTPDGTATVTRTDQLQTIAYQVTDRDGLTATAFLLVPGTRNQPPRIRAGVPNVRVESGGSVTVDLGDRVEDPDGDAVHVVADAGATARVGDVRVSGDRLRYTAPAGYSGSDAMTVTVADAPPAEHGEPATVELSIPVDVIPNEPVPPRFGAASLTVRAGGPARRLALDQFVQDADRSPATRYRFGGPQGAPGGVVARLLPGNVLEVTAATSAAPARTALSLSLSDGESPTVRATVGLTILEAEYPPIVARDDAATVPAGRSVRVDVLANDYDPAPGTSMRVLRAEVLTSGAGAARVSGGGVEFTAASGAVGRAVVRYEVGDDTGHAERQGVGYLTVTVLGPPGAPGKPEVVDVSDASVTLRWAAAPDNGSAIERYVVQAAGGFSQTCSATTCVLQKLTNGRPYTFTVVAHNAAGAGPASPASEQATPRNVPDTPGVPTATLVKGGDGGRLAVSWAPVRAPGGGAVRYEVRATPGGRTQSTTGTDLVFTDLVNGTGYTFSVRAAAGGPFSEWGPESAPETPAGVPATPRAPDATTSAAGGRGRVTVSWAAPDDRGASITGYAVAVYQDGGQIGVQSLPGNQRSFDLPVDFDRDYSFTVTAANRSGISGTSDRSAPVHVVSPPGQVSSVSVDERDRAVRLGFTNPGGQIDSFQVSVNGGDWRRLDGKVVDGLRNGEEYRFRVRACNENCGEASPSSAVAVPYGSPLAPSGVDVGMAHTGKESWPTGWSGSWCPAAENGRPIVRYEYSFDGGPWRDSGDVGGSCGVGAGGDVSGFGSHTLTVRAIDSEGQKGGTASASYSLPRTTVGLEFAPVDATDDCPETCFTVVIHASDVYFVAENPAYVPFDPGPPRVRINGASACDFGPIRNDGTYTDSSCLVTSGDLVRVALDTLFGQTATDTALAH